MLKIGLTGGIASGKSRVSFYFSVLSAPIIDADKISRSLLEKNSPLLKPIKQKFGAAIFDNNNQLDRKALGKIVFNSPKDLEWLNQLMHPLINQQIKQQLTKIDFPYVILDIPLLINQQGKISAHLKPMIDRILVVDIDPNIQIERLCARDNIDQEAALTIIKNQSSREQKLALADDTIDNNGNFLQLESQVQLLHNQYLLMAGETSA